MNKKVPVIGLDGATFATLKPMMDGVVMPYLTRFVNEGSHGDLTSTRNALTPPAWVSMLTGGSPLRIGTGEATGARRKSSEEERDALIGQMKILGYTD